MVKAVVLLSGGIDSAVSLFISLHKGWELHPLTFNYYMRPKREVEAVAELTDLCGCRENLIRVDLPFLMEIEDMLEHGLDNSRLKRAPSTYIPARNLIFYSVAAHYAEVRAARWIVGGHNGFDSSIFPDASPEFFEAMNRILGLGLLTGHDSPVEVINPLQGLSKTDVIRIGREHQVPLETTWSCAQDLEMPCGECLSCKERAEAFRRAELDDPLLLRISRKVL